MFSGPIQNVLYKDSLHFGKESAHLARLVARTSQFTVPKKLFFQPDDRV